MLFATLGGFSAIILGYCSIRQPETLTRRWTITFSHLNEALWTVLTNEQSLHFRLATGVGFSGLLSYLSSAQNTFQDIYRTGD